MSMAYIVGRPLSEFIASEKVFRIRQLVKLVRKLTLAMQEAHRQGIVHRDLKPANIMVDQQGEPLIMDFGLASRESDVGPRLTHSGAIVGTPAYMAPEQLSGQATGPAGDIYSLGVVFYELLTGRLPFEGDLVDLVAQVACDEPRKPSEFRADVPKQLDDMCLKALAKTAENRFASMGEFAQELALFLTESSTVEATPTSDQESSAKSTRTYSWWHHLFASISGIALATLGVIVACLLFSLNAADPSTINAKPIPQESIAILAAGEIPRGGEQSTATGSSSAGTELDELPEDARVGPDEADSALPRNTDSRDIESAPSQTTEVSPATLPNVVLLPETTASLESDPSDLTARQGSESSQETIVVDAPTEIESKSNPTLETLPSTVAAASNVFFQKALDELREIAFERTELIDNTKRAITRYEVGLPDEYVRESGKLAELNRSYRELGIEIQDLESLIRERTIENTRRDLNRLDRLAISADLERYGRQSASAIKRRSRVSVEIAPE